MKHAYVNCINIAGRELALSRPVRPHLARRLVDELPRLNALNAAQKSLDDAAVALETTVPTLRTWLDITNTTWRNVKRRGPYASRR